ncbi:hypothetical protein GGU10DRAFT_389982 [Lentinula aff. detonsa]|uniref:UDP-Glycosyltransferase/glycogen phosphorylase n=1 Tax=Lentinula aff. detonsa TaxID=2804958 RepID=A0AA38KPT2_9AGAR|nr:hypothetical protein GGU10DRAFT_389982 [Lentinula aff. detonsa]
MGSIDNRKHVVVYAIPVAWGHNKPLCAFAVQILENQPEAIVTYFTTSNTYPKIIAEFKRLEPTRYAALEPRLNIINIAGPVVDPFQPLDAFEPNFAALYSSSSVTCLSTDRTISGLPRPTLAIIDPFAGYAFECIRRIAGRSVSILAWWTSNAGSLLRLFGPGHLGGVAEPSLETAEGRSAIKKKIIAKEQIKWHDCIGNVVDIAGISPSYDYEWFPQKTVMTDIAAVAEKAGSIYVREADGVICVSTRAFEPEAAAVAKEWFSSMGKTWHTVGPLSIHVPGVKTSKSSQTTDQTDVLVEAFLNRMQREFGDQSLLYMSFGTVFWPEEDDRVWAVIDGLLEKRQPFLFSHPSPLLRFPDEVKKKIDANGIAMELSWSPQEMILTHPVTGWFLTHGGWNSVQEAFTHRVPTIFWPFHADQPYNAMRLLALKAGFELIEVRTGPIGARIPYKCKELPAFTPASAKAEIMGLIEKLKAQEGFIVRQNFEAVADAVCKAWDTPNGESRKDTKAMLKEFF